ncbi:MAG: glycosyltransferase family 2 protein [Dechloromonas sp.]|uniref:glycosyltransferase family 2 protein n=1 Tax=Dechloromonas sp. TaxID=1917218 RepID=UPI0027EED23D|nr:glycosyltransferase family 2 protein [Dechloromonas sp.]MBT9521154.1 glycosyltransferase family 2 protein [Dechloromonas sp.]
MKQHEGFVLPDQSLYCLSVVVPAYNEEEVLPELYRRLSAVLSGFCPNYEILFVNDGSRDGTLEVMRNLKTADAHVGYVNLSRNFGKEIAMTAGLDAARGDAVVVIDADLQDPPELIPQLIDGWREGFDVVYARRVSRSGETWLKKATASAFYKTIQRIGPVSIPEDVGDFRLMSRRAVNALKQIRERHRFMKGLFAWIGFSQKAIDYQRDARFAGETKWNYWKLWNFAIEGITSFSIAPLKVSTYLGLFVALLAFLYAIFVIYKTIMFGDPVKGYPSLMAVVLFLGGIQLVGIGLLGEYVGRMFVETKYRPLYLLDEVIPAEAIKLTGTHGNEQPGVVTDLPISQQS